MRVHVIKKARKADPDNGIAVGDAYYWWKFRKGGLHKSKTYPRRSQLTMSSFLSGLYDTQDTLEEAAGKAKTVEDFTAAIEEAKSSLESLSNDCQNSLDNMPDSLRESSSSGELLQSRIDNLDEYINNLDAVDLSELEELENSDAVERACDGIVNDISGTDPGVE